jgi:hypothetical protein
MSTQQEISGPAKPFTRALRKFHITIFIVLILGLLSFAVLLLYGILNSASFDPDYKSPISAGSIDQATLDRVNALYSSNGELPPAPTPTGRFNPFTE